MTDTAPQPDAPPPPPTGADTPATTHGDDSAARDVRLAQAVSDAYTLLDFSCRQGDPPPDAISRTLIDAFDTMTADRTLTAEAEAAFWTAFAAITRRVRPVTVDSILFTMPPPHVTGERAHRSRPGGLFKRALKPAGPAEKVLRHYLAAALGTLLVLLVLQMEWAIGTYIYNDAYKVHHHLQDAQTRMLEARQTHDNAQGTPGADQAAINLDKARAVLKLDRSWADVSYERLRWWNRSVAAHIPPYDLNIKSAPNSQKDDTGHRALDADGRERLEITRTELTLQVISNYLLVALFALLGALTQALRALAADIDRVALTANDLYSMRTRVILGVISGVCMAWLYIITSQPPSEGADRAPLNPISFLGAFAPWAVAFISGYSVEIFFALLERLITLATTKIKGLNTNALDTDAPRQSPPRQSPPQRTAPPDTAAQPQPPQQPASQG